MKRSRKSLSQTPVQKTTILNYFQRTPSTGVAGTPARSGTLLNYFEKTPLATVPIKSKLNVNTDLPTSTPSTSRVLETPRRVDSTETVGCPGCKKTIPLYRLNDHLDLECIISSSQPCSYPIKTPLNDLAVPIKIQFDSPSPIKTPPRTPKQHHVSYKRNVYSSSKKNSARKRVIAEGFQPRQFDTDVKKLSASTDNDPSAVRKRLFADVIVKKKYSMPYYLETFLFLLKSTFDEPLHQHLFIPEEHQLYQTFQSLSMDAKKLYVRYTKLKQYILVNPTL